MMDDEGLREVDRQRIQNAMRRYRAGQLEAERAHQELMALDGGILVGRLLSVALILLAVCLLSTIAVDLWRLLQ